MPKSLCPYLWAATNTFNNIFVSVKLRSILLIMNSMYLLSFLVHYTKLNIDKQE